MSTKRGGGSGQSGCNFIHNDTGVPQTALPTFGTANAQKIIDPTSAEAALNQSYVIEGTAIGGNGVCMDSAPAMTLGGDNFYGDSGSECFVRPSDPSLPTWDDHMAWPLTVNGTTMKSTYAAMTTQQKAETEWINWIQWEYDAAGYAINTWTGGNPMIYCKALWRLMSEIRAAIGKTAAQLPVMIWATGPYSPGSDAGNEAVWAAIHLAAADRTQNMRVAGGNNMDLRYDRNDGSGGNDYVLRFHPHADDQRLIARRYGMWLPRVHGRRLAPTNYKPMGNIGPRVVWAQQVDPSTIDVSFRHDTGNDFTLPSNPAFGWRVTYAGKAITVSSLVKIDKRSVRLTLASPCPAAWALKVFYAWGAARLMIGSQGAGASGIYDNATTANGGIAIPATITGADRINGVLHRTPPGGVTVQTTAPPPRHMLPLAP